MSSSSREPRPRTADTATRSDEAAAAAPPSVALPGGGPDAPAREGRLLLGVARESLRCGVERGRALRPDPLAYPEPLRALRASFVTLERAGELRGCIGGLEPLRPLVLDVAEHAFAAGFRDPRFPPLAESELADLEIQLSLLSALEPLAFASEDDLLVQLRPGVDGVLLEAGGRRGTFLPSVWEQLPAPREFVRQLKRKAGLPADYWSERVVVRRYTVESIGEA